MSNSNKSLADRIAVMQAHCFKENASLSFILEDNSVWLVIFDGEAVGEPSDDFEEALSSAESELYITDGDQL